MNNRGPVDRRSMDQGPMDQGGNGSGPMDRGPCFLCGTTLSTMGWFCTHVDKFPMQKERISMKVLRSMHCVFLCHYQTYDATSDWLGQEKNAIQGNHCALKTPNREPIVFGPHTPKYYNTPDWLCQGQIQITPYRENIVFWKHHTGIPLCLDLMIQAIFSMC